MTEDGYPLAFLHNGLRYLLLVLVQSSDLSLCVEALSMINISPPQSLYERSQSLTRFAAVHWAQEILVEDVLADVGLEKDKNGSVRDGFEEMSEE